MHHRIRARSGQRAAGLRRLPVALSRCGSTSPANISASRPRNTRCCSPARRLRSAAGRVDRDAPALPAAVAEGGPWQLYGFASPGDGNSWIATVVQLPEFLARTCLTYCEFYELWQAGFVRFLSSDERAERRVSAMRTVLPRRPLAALSGQGAITRGEPDAARGLHPAVAQAQGVVLPVSCRSPSCATSATCCSCLPAARPTPTSSASSPPSRCCASSSAWNSAIRTTGRRRRRSMPTGRRSWRCGSARRRRSGAGRSASCATRSCSSRAAAAAASTVPAISQRRWPPISTRCRDLPASTRPRPPTTGMRCRPTRCVSQKSWPRSLSRASASPSSSTCSRPPTIRAAASRSRCRTSSRRRSCRSACRTTKPRFSLWRLRRELLAAAEEADGEDWHWRRVADFLEDELGFAAGDVLALAQHVFPHVLERDGHKVDAAAPRYVSSLPTAKTTPAMWTGRAGSPFQYDAAAAGGELWARIPIPDHEVVEQLTSLRAAQRRRAGRGAGPVFPAAGDARPLRPPLS